ncbi:TPA: hypothetical protein ENX78_14335 [Candidatus Poribacteria bacterium]|nr:hypothetical protein [Candidatus Poribacteria bacterium]
MKIFVVYIDDQFSKSIAYTFDLILSVLSLEYEILSYSEFASRRVENKDILISYGHKGVGYFGDNRIHIYQSEFFGDNYMKPESMPKLPLKRYKDIPIIYEGNGDLSEFVVRNGNVIETNIDIIASSFFMLSRYEEYLVDERDQYDRFPASASVAYKEGFLTRPIVNEYIELLWEWIDGFNLGFKRKRLWGDKDFVACLTHDIDFAKKWNREGIYSEIRHWGSIALKKHKPVSAIRRMKKALNLMIRRIDPYWNYKEIIELEKRYGFSSSFYFFGGGDFFWGVKAKYSVKDKKIADLIHEIKDSGCEVGLHGSFNSYNDLEMLQSEKESLEKIVGEIYSIRQHYLRFDVKKTYAIYEKLGIKCDVTLGYAQHEGFRAGICLPYHPYSLDEDRPYNVIEIPLTVMDCTLGDPIYRNLDTEESLSSIESLLAQVKKYNGCIVILFHNTYLDVLGHSEYMSIYKQCLEWVMENNGVCMSPKQSVEDFVN